MFHTWNIWVFVGLCLFEGPFKVQHCKSGISHHSTPFPSEALRIRILCFLEVHKLHIYYFASSPLKVLVKIIFSCLIFLLRSCHLLSRLSLSKSATSLVGVSEHFLFFHILGIIIPTDSYFSEGWLNHQPNHLFSFRQQYLLLTSTCWRLHYASRLRCIAWVSCQDIKIDRQNMSFRPYTCLNTLNRLVSNYDFDIL